MTISITKDHFLLDDAGPTITAFGYEATWLCLGVTEADGSHTFYRELMIERLDIKRTWHWRKGLGRWTSTLDGEIRTGVGEVRGLAQGDTERLAG
jgi:hypothetical protein